MPARPYAGGRGIDRDAAVSERGGGTILVLAGMSVLLTAGLMACAIGSAVILHTRAAGAADLAALAGATAALEGSDVACARASEVAAANRGRLQSCRLTGSEVWVEVGVATPLQLQRILRAPALARAQSHAELVPKEDP